MQEMSRARPGAVGERVVKLTFGYWPDVGRMPMGIWGFRLASVLFALNLKMFKP